MADDLRTWVEAGKAAIDAIKLAIGLIPQGPDREKAEAALRDAEAARARSDAVLASYLGHPTCDGHWPPVPMIREGRSMKCPSCGRVSGFDRPLPPAGGGWQAR